MFRFILTLFDLCLRTRTTHSLHSTHQIMFGHAVTVFFKDVFAKHAALFKQLNVNANNGFGDVVAKLKTLPEEQRKAVEADIDAAYASRPALAMVRTFKRVSHSSCMLVCMLM